MKRQTNRGVIPFIILTIIAIFVILFAVGYFTDSHPFGFANYKKALNLPCGLTVYAPKKNAQMGFPYKIYGYANGCDWDQVGGKIGTVRVLASNGLVVAQADLPVSSVSDGAPYYFEATVDVPILMFSDEPGTVVFNNLLPGLQQHTITIPIRFASHL